MESAKEFEKKYVIGKIIKAVIRACYLYKYGEYDEKRALDEYLGRVVDCHLVASQMLHAIVDSAAAEIYMECAERSAM